MRNRVVPWVPAAVWAAVLFLASAQEAIGIDLSGGQDKIAHFGAYLVLGLLLTHATSRSGMPVLLAIGLGFFYGVTDEMHQSRVPGRSAELADWIADAAGTLVGVLIYLWVSRLRAPAEPSPTARPEPRST